MGWKYYFPEDGTEAEDAFSFPQGFTFFDAEDAAREACRRDFNCHDGWERGTASEFTIVVIDLDGNEHRFTGLHEQTVDHMVLPVRKVD